MFINSLFNKVFSILADMTVTFFWTVLYARETAIPWLQIHLAFFCIGQLLPQELVWLWYMYYMRFVGFYELNDFIWSFLYCFLNMSKTSSLFVTLFFQFSYIKIQNLLVYSLYFISKWRHNLKDFILSSKKIFKHFVVSVHL